MPHNRYFLDAPFQENETVILSDDEFHHLARVSRTRIGETIELVNGRGQLAKASVTEMHKHSAKLRLGPVLNKPSSKTPLILAQALTRMNHLEWIIEKGTELNVAAFWLFPGILSEKDGLSETQTLRLKHLTVSAMKQCGRLDLPNLEMRPSLLTWEPLPGTLLFGHTQEQTPYLWDLPLAPPIPSPLVIFIGPESGFDSRESSFLQKSLNAKGVRLHPNILRVETASIVALGLINQFITI